MTTGVFTKQIKPVPESSQHVPERLTDLRSDVLSVFMGIFLLETPPQLIFAWKGHFLQFLWKHTNAISMTTHTAGQVSCVCVSVCV